MAQQCRPPIERLIAKTRPSIHGTIDHTTISLYTKILRDHRTVNLSSRPTSRYKPTITNHPSLLFSRANQRRSTVNQTAHYSTHHASAGSTPHVLLRKYIIPHCTTQSSSSRQDADNSTLLRAAPAHSVSQHPRLHIHLHRPHKNLPPSPPHTLSPAPPPPDSLLLRPTNSHTHPRHLPRRPTRSAGAHSTQSLYLHKLDEYWGGGTGVGRVGCDAGTDWVGKR